MTAAACYVLSIIVIYRLLSFQAGGKKLERFLPKNQHTQRKLLNFENWCNGVVSKIGHCFRKWSYLKIDILQWKKWERFRWFFILKIYFEIQIDALFDASKFNNFLWVCLFLGKNLSNFVPTTWKLNNPYYHSAALASHCCR